VQLSLAGKDRSHLLASPKGPEYIWLGPHQQLSFSVANRSRSAYRQAHQVSLPQQISKFEGQTSDTSERNQQQSISF